MGKQGKLIDLTGKRYGRWLVLYYDKNKRWICRCNCGTEISVDGSHLRRGNSKSCGCYQRELLSNRRRANLVGKRFGRWLVLRFHKVMPTGDVRWWCKCDCGVEKSIRGSSLGKSSISCGCYMKEILSKKRKGQKASVETRRKMSKSREGLKNHFYGKKHSLEARKKMSDNHPDWKREKSPCWNPELTDEERYDERNTLEHRIWRRDVLKKDNYTCVKCGVIGGKLIAHHLEGYKNNKHLRFVVSNGVTCCETCHIIFHVKYGRGGNTREQFNEFMKEDWQSGNALAC